MLLPGLRNSVHQRLQQRSQVLALDTSGTVTHFYPLLLPLVSTEHTGVRLIDSVIEFNMSEYVKLLFPSLLQPLSAEDSIPPNPEGALRCRALSLEPRGLYLVHAPLTLLLWVGTQVPASTLVELFNTSCFSALSSGEVSD